jgi:hypothetical protein
LFRPIDSIGRLRISEQSLSLASNGNDVVPALEREFTVPARVLVTVAAPERMKSFRYFDQEGNSGVKFRTHSIQNNSLASGKLIQIVTDEQSLDDSLASRRLGYSVISVDTNVLLRWHMHVGFSRSLPRLNSFEEKMVPAPREDSSQHCCQYV